MAALWWAFRGTDRWVWAETRLTGSLITVIQHRIPDCRFQPAPVRQPLFHSVSTHGSEIEVGIFNDAKSIAKGIEYRRNTDALAHIVHRLERRGAQRQQSLPGAIGIAHSP